MSGEPKPKMDDNSLMPFGKYKDMKLANVDPSYLLWALEQAWINDWPALRDYITDNKPVIQEEYERKYMSNHNGKKPRF